MVKINTEVAHRICGASPMSGSHPLRTETTGVSTFTPSIRFGPLLAAATGLAAIFFSSQAQAWPTPSQSIRQHATSAVVQVQASADFNVTNVAGPSGTPLPMKIKLPENAAAQYGFLMFRKLPPNFQLSSGFGTKTYWAVSLNDAEKIQIVPPGDYTGSFELEVLLVKGLGVEPERRVATVAFNAPGSGNETAGAETGDNDQLFTAANERDVTAAIPEQPGSIARSDGGALLQPQEMSPRDKAIMERGNQYLELGDVASARLIFHSLAKKGFADGAFAMARTYDPDFLAALAVRGLQPSVEEAKSWYARAKELGSEQAARRLATLNASDN